MLARVLQWLEVPVLIAVPFALGACAVLRIDQSAIVTLVVAAVALGVFFAGFESRGPALRQVMPAAVLGSVAAAGRILFAPIPDFKPVTAICIVAGVVFGRRCGFMVGALAALVSNFFFGQGMWTPWQMYSWGLIGYLAGVLADCGVFGQVTLGKTAADGEPKPRIAVVCTFGFLSCLLFGFIMNTWTLIGFVHPASAASAIMVYAMGLPLDVFHGIATILFLLVIYAPWVRKLERIRKKYALMA